MDSFFPKNLSGGIGAQHTGSAGAKEKSGFVERAFTGAVRVEYDPLVAFKRSVDREIWRSYNACAHAANQPTVSVRNAILALCTLTRYDAYLTNGSFGDILLEMTASRSPAPVRDLIRALNCLRIADPDDPEGDGNHFMAVAERGNTRTIYAMVPSVPLMYDDCIMSTEIPRLKFIDYREGGRAYTVVKLRYLLDAIFTRIQK